MDKMLTGQTTSYLPWIMIVGMWRLRRIFRLWQDHDNGPLASCLSPVPPVADHLSWIPKSNTGYQKCIHEKIISNLVDKIVILDSSKRTEGLTLGVGEKSYIFILETCMANFPSSAWAMWFGSICSFDVDILRSHELANGQTRKRSRNTCSHLAQALAAVSLVSSSAELSWAWYARIKSCRSASGMGAIYSSL